MEVTSRLIAVVCLLFIAGKSLVVSGAEQDVLSQGHSLSLKATTVNCVDQLTNVISYLNQIDKSVNAASKKTKDAKVKQLFLLGKVELLQVRTKVNQFKFDGAMVNVGNANRHLQGAYKLYRSADLYVALNLLKTVYSTLNTLFKYCIPKIPSCVPPPAKAPTPSTPSPVPSSPVSATPPVSASPPTSTSPPVPTSPPVSASPPTSTSPPVPTSAPVSASPPTSTSAPVSASPLPTSPVPTNPPAESTPTLSPTTSPLLASVPAPTPSNAPSP